MSGAKLTLESAACKALCQMHCAEPAGMADQEVRYLAALQTAAIYRVEGTRLEMRTTTGALGRGEGAPRVTR